MYKSRAGESFDGANSDYGYIETDPTGRYGRFKEVLGRGAMKTVYRAFDEVLGMEVAWNQAKLNDVLQSPEELQRLYSEVHLLGTLNHDSIIKFYTSWIDVDRRNFNFITEMFTSGTLREYRHRYKRIDIRAIKNWARQILNGLVYLHGHDPPVIHRDLKCDNVFINGHLGQVKIGDLGLAAILRGSQAAHSVIGTPEFMAPELYEEEYNELVDIYSFGMCVLEMLTAEYPYSECSNPAQIYKKVTSGKLPDAFYRIHDLEARKFVGKCLQTASKRLPAKDLLLDPFLALDDTDSLLLPKTLNHHNLIPNGSTISPPMYSPLPENTRRSTDMKITGKMNHEDDTIFLKVQIADKNGSVKHIYFPFDIKTDTPIDVATEMVKELEIADREPFEIAEVIDKEISSLVPSWKKWDPPNMHHPHHTFCYLDDDDEVEEEDGNGGLHPSFCSFSSCSSSSQTSPSRVLPSHGTHFLRGDDLAHDFDWLQGGLFIDEDESSESSEYSGKYSNLNYNSGNEEDLDPSPRRREHYPNIAMAHLNCTRFCHEESQIIRDPISANYYNPNKFQVELQRVSSSNKQRRIDNSKMTRMRSYVDIRSQLLHRSLVEEVNKRRLFKTVGAVENIGFQAPCEVSGKVTKPICGGCVRNSGHGKKKGCKW